MAQASRPPSGQNTDRPSSVAPPRSAPPMLDGLNSAAAGLGQHQHELVDRSPQSIIEGILGPNKDGRVRNPVPSKLKGKTDNKQGNFGVMHMAGVKKNEAQGKDAAAERDAAARRTSENTASRAKAAQQEKYVPPKKRGLEASLNDVTRNTNRGSPFGRDDKRQARPLAPDETKMEQARLLTLLRSINPITVVDQICKAVAYFGGIPGAPPPEDGIFPESANTRETGALFIGWLAEIFPDVSAGKPTELMRPPDGKKKSRPSQGQQVTASPADAAASSEEPNSRNGYGFGPAVSAPAWGLPQNLAEVNPQAPTVPDTTNEQNNQSVQPSQQQVPVTPAQAPAADMTSNTASASTKRRGRGRPKGSTNKKVKGDGQQGEFAVDGMNNGHIDGQNMASDMLQAQDLGGGALNPSAQNQGQPALHPAMKQSVVPVPKASQVSQYSDQSWQTNPQKDHLGQSSVIIPDELSPEERAVLEAFRNAGPDGAMSAVSAVGGAVAPVPSPVIPTKGPAEGGVKRKRAPAKPKATPILPPNTVIPNSTAASSAGYGSQSSPQAQQQQLQKQTQQAPKVQQNQHSMPQMQHLQSRIPQQASGNGALSNANDDLAMNMAKDAMQWGQVDATPPAPTAPPPAKRQRQRKPKVPAAASVTAIEPPSRTQTASVTSAATPILPPSTIPDSQDVASQQISQPSIPVSRPTEGLEAHFERFATHTTHQNGRSHTPTMPQQQKQQQHVRQQSKPTSVPPPQSTPHMPQQMQQQKSQQGAQQSLQRNDMKTAQDPSTRPSSSTFYNQRSQSTASYNQQYPSHQASQLYGTQSASPQMGSSNSYRTNSSHTMAQSTMSQNSLAQASPQFSQAEAYRTASPHVAQPSPSFSQNESNYRTTSTHAMAQPSPSFSQAENPYRTPSTHSLTQGTSAYTTSRSHTHAPSTHQSQSQNHYNQFSDSSYIDLPMPLQSLGHTGSGSAASLGGYGQGLGSLGGGTSNTSSHSRSTDSSASLYGTTSSGLGPFESTADNLLRMSRGPVSGGTNHANTHAHSAYGRTSSGMGSAFDSEHEMREQLLRGMGSRQR